MKRNILAVVIPALLVAGAANAAARQKGISFFMIRDLQNAVNYFWHIELALLCFYSKSRIQSWKVGTIMCCRHQKVTISLKEFNGIT